ncbi:MAG TPA: hypothetical protein DIT04_02195 [Dysgonomonas sp.]|nr:hypothetical protein [Dysgonomonas sp.]
MKKNLLVLCLLLFSSILVSQTISLPEKELTAKLDSILKEANMLYQYEKAAWNGCDLAIANDEVKLGFRGYFVYQTDEGIHTIILGENFETSIAEYIFKDDFTNPYVIKTEKRPLSNKEKALISIRGKIIENISSDKYEVGVPDGFNLNLILLPFADLYKLYIITGTPQSDIIPFGNDYLFISDKNGNIESYKKFHSRLIPAYIQHDDKMIISVTHSHLRDNPLITATDICTFKLYAPLYNMNSFSVYSPAIGKYMEYNIIDDNIVLK